MGTGVGDREVLKLELAEEVLNSSGELRFVARGASMIPAIFPGDMLIVRDEAMGDVGCGDVVLWTRDGRLCAHRVVKTESSNGSAETSELVTRGDALEEDDPAVHSEEFLGRVHAIVRRGKCIVLASRQNGMMRVLAVLARRSDSAARWLVRCNSLMCWLTRNRPTFPVDRWHESVESE